MLLESTFSEHGRIAYQNKGNHKCSNVVANILPADPHGHVAYLTFDHTGGGGGGG